MSSGVREGNSYTLRVIKGLINNEAAFIQSLRVFANTSTLSGLGVTGGITSNSPQIASGNYFRRSGDYMIGQSGDNYGIIEIIDGTLNVSKSNGDISPLILLNPEGGVVDELDTIIDSWVVMDKKPMVVLQVLDLLFGNRGKYAKHNNNRYVKAITYFLSALEKTGYEIGRSTE